MGVAVMNFWKWIGSDQRVEEALAQTTSIDISPSNDDLKKNVNAPVYWEEIAFAGASNNNTTNAASKLSLWTDYQPGEDATKIKDAELWTELSKR